MNLQLSGLASGFDWSTMVEQLAALERAPQTRLRTEQTTLGSRSSAYGNIVTELLALQDKVDALKDLTLYNQRNVALSNFSAATASAAASTPLGSYTFAFSQLATAAIQKGATNIGAPVNASNDVSALVLSDAEFATAVTAGTFTVNGGTVTIATTDTLQAVFTKISTATGGLVTGSYNSATDKITLTSASAITLGSSGDTSNFLTVAKLTHNGTGTVNSAAALGTIKLGSALNAANFSTAVTDGGSGAGAFKVNGITINFNASTDSLSTVLGRINDSAAGVVAQYDAVNDQVTLTNKNTGDIGIALQDVTGNFLAATKVTTAAGGTLTAGKDLQYTLNGGTTLTSHSNTITADNHGITGLSVNALTGASSTTATASGALGFPMLIAAFGGSGIQTRVRTTPPHNYQTGYAVKFATAGSLPSQVNAATTYYVRRIDANNVSIHPTATDAVNNTNAINFGNTPAWSGDTYMTQVDPTVQSTTTSTPSSVTVTVSGDAAAVKTGIADFVSQYNKVQSLIGTNTASTTDDKGKVTAGILAGDRDIAGLASELRSRMFGQITGLTGTISQLAALGYSTNGNDDKITLTDEATLDAKLAANATGIQDFFTNATKGLAVTLSSYLETKAGDDGALVKHQDLLGNQSKSIDDQIADMEKIVQSNRQRLIDQFVALERAQAQSNQQLQFLQQQLK